jgi:hypothetical protein
MDSSTDARLLMETSPEDAALRCLPQRLHTRRFRESLLVRRCPPQRRTLRTESHWTGGNLHSIAMCLPGWRLLCAAKRPVLAYTEHTATAHVFLSASPLIGPHLRATGHALLSASPVSDSSVKRQQRISSTTSINSVFEFAAKVPSKGSTQARIRKHRSQVTSDA